MASKLDYKVLLLPVLVAISCAKARDVTNEQCAEPCEIDNVNYTMNCNKRRCTNTPMFDTTSCEHFWSTDEICSMERLFLQDNFLTNLTAFGEYKYLTAIDLSHNQINSISSAAFEKCDSLKILVLAHNKINSLNQDYFKGLETLEQLDLRDNEISIVTDNVFYVHLRNLKRLELSGNRIKEITANAFTDLIELKFLHLENNFLHKVDSRDFLGLRNLEDLHLQRNGIGDISEALFNECSKLQYLDLSDNLIKTMEPKCFSGLDKLKILHLNGNLIQEVTGGVFSSLPSLEHIYLNSNPIKTITSGSLPTSLQKISMQNMKELRIIHNGTFTGLSSLHTVQITDSKNFVLLDVGAFDQENSSIVVLDLFNNSLKTVYENLMNWSLIESLNLGKNRWNCDCDIAWAKHSEYIPPEVKDSMTCYEPYHLHGKRISEVDFEQFSCAFYDVHRGGIEAAVILLVTAVFLTAAGLLMFQFRHTVLPCIFKTPGKYSTMYNAVSTEEEDAVEVTWKKENEKILPGPTPV